MGFTCSVFFLPLFTRIRRAQMSLPVIVKRYWSNGLGLYHNNVQYSPPFNVWLLQTLCFMVYWTWIVWDVNLVLATNCWKLWYIYLLLIFSVVWRVFLRSGWNRWMEISDVENLIFSLLRWRHALALRSPQVIVEVPDDNRGLLMLVHSVIKKLL